MAQRRTRKRGSVAPQQPSAAGSQQRVEQLTHDAPRVATLELGGASGKDGHPGIGGPLSRLEEQPGLADPRLALDKQRRSFA